MKTTVVLFRATDGRWTYCPEPVRDWPAFNMIGEYESLAEARDALRRDPDASRMRAKIEADTTQGDKTP